MAYLSGMRNVLALTTLVSCQLFCPQRLCFGADIVEGTTDTDINTDSALADKFDRIRTRINRYERENDSQNIFSERRMNAIRDALTRSVTYPLMVHVFLLDHFFDALLRAITVMPRNRVRVDGRLNTTALGQPVGAMIIELKRRLPLRFRLLLYRRRNDVDVRPALAELRLAAERRRAPIEPSIVEKILRKSTQREMEETETNETDPTRLDKLANVAAAHVAIQLTGYAIKRFEETSTLLKDHNRAYFRRADWRGMKDKYRSLFGLHKRLTFIRGHPQTNQRAIKIKSMEQDRSKQRSKAIWTREKSRKQSQLPKSPPLWINDLFQPGGVSFVRLGVYTTFINDIDRIISYMNASYLP